MTPETLARVQRWTAAVVLYGGVGVAAFQAAVRLAVLGRPMLPPGMAPGAGGIGSASAGGISEDVVFFLPAALAAAWCLARAPGRRRWWAPAYLGVVAIYAVARVGHDIGRAGTFMRGLQEQGGEYLTRPQPYGVGDIVWIAVDGALFASLFVALWLRLQPVRVNPPSRSGTP